MKKKPMFLRSLIRFLSPPFSLRRYHFPHIMIYRRHPTRHEKRIFGYPIEIVHFHTYFPQFKLIQSCCLLETRGYHSVCRCRLDLAVLIVEDLLGLDGPQMVHPAAELAVMIEEVRFALVLDNGMMRRPPEHRLQDPAPVREGPKGTIPRGVAQIVRVAGRVGEVVRAVALVHPRSLEEAPVVVVSQDGLPRIGGQDGDFLHLGGKVVHVLCQAGHAGALGLDALAAALLWALPFVVELVVAVLVALELAAPETAKVEVRLAVVVDKGRRIDAVRPLDGLRVRLEGSLGRITLCDADAEDALLVAGGEVEVVLPVLGGGVGGPELLGDPGDVVGDEDGAVVGDGL